VPIIYNLRHLLVRKVSTVLTALGIAMVVFIFTSMLAFVQGFRVALVATGRADNALVMRGGATSEIESYLDREDASMIRALPEIARDAGGEPLASADLVTVISRPKRGAPDEPANVSVRGVSPAAFALHPAVRVVEGRSFAPGLAEVIVGKSLSRRIADTSVGDRIRFGGQEWQVVGIFEAEGTAYESEIWGDAELFLPAFDRPGFQSVTVRLADPGRFDAFKQRMESDPQLEVQVLREPDYYRRQSKTVASLLTTLSVFIGVVMSVGAVFGALNTMYAAVGSRTREIGTLLAIGFTPGAVLRSFLLESLLLAGAGGAAGVLLALAVSHGRSTGTTNWSSFSELTFRVTVSPGVVVAGLGFALLRGAVGGLWPARRAARMRVAEAVRAV
jgi:ABC-type lipoprotein release transport system permease subunit